MGHNPTGIVQTVERRKAIYALCCKYDVVIVEDDPYWYLQFPSAALEEAASRNLPRPVAAAATTYPPPKSSGYPFIDSLVPSYLSVDVEGRVVRLDTFSKTVAPGCRLGWITAQPALIERLVRITETSTAAPSGFVQSMVSELVLGSQPAAVEAFRALRTPRERANFGGWRMDGWVRWLEGLRGEYERRMGRMCSILDEGAVQLKQGTPVRASDAEWGVITKTQLYTFDWPRGGMFVWLRMHFEAHPLWQATGSSGEPISGTALSIALMSFLTREPFLVLVAPGLNFSATDAIRRDVGWAYFRLCFAAEAEENIDIFSRHFVDGVQKFWRIKSVKELEEILKDVPSAEDYLLEAGGPGGGWEPWFGC